MTVVITRKIVEVMIITRKIVEVTIITKIIIIIKPKVKLGQSILRTNPYDLPHC